MNACWVRQSASLNAVNHIVFKKKKMFSGEIIIHIKKILKMLCYYKWKAW